MFRNKKRHRIEGVEKVDTLRQNQDFDEVTVCINSTFHRHKNALKRAVFLVGSEFRLRIPVGKPTPQEMRTAINGWHLRSKCVDPLFPNPFRVLEKIYTFVFLQFERRKPWASSAMSIKFFIFRAVLDASASVFLLSSGAFVVPQIIADLPCLCEPLP